MTAPVITWADKRLQQAHSLIEAVAEEQHPETDAACVLSRVLEGVEQADCEMEKLVQYAGRWAA